MLHKTWSKIPTIAWRSKRSRKSKTFLTQGWLSSHLRMTLTDSFHSRWWFASTACPLLAGTFGPLANAFSICALVEKWRVYIPPGLDETVGKPVQDPSW